MRHADCRFARRTAGRMRLDRHTEIRVTAAAAHAAGRPAGAGPAGCAALAVITVGVVVVAFGAWAAWAMAHTIHAEDVEAEILPEQALAEPLPGHPHLQGRGPVD